MPATIEKPAEKLADKTQADGWVCPEVQIGDIVYWFHGGHKDGQKPVTAIVTGMGWARGRTLDVTLLRPSAELLGTRNAVRHVDDPGATSEAKHNEGGWCVIPGSAVDLRVRMLVLEAEIADMRELVKAL